MVKIHNPEEDDIEDGENSSGITKLANKIIDKTDDEEVVKLANDIIIVEDGE